MPRSRDFSRQPCWPLLLLRSMVATEPSSGACTTRSARPAAGGAASATGGVSAACDGVLRCTPDDGPVDTGACVDTVAHVGTVPAATVCTNLTSRGSLRLLYGPALKRLLPLLTAARMPASSACLGTHSESCMHGEHVLRRGGARAAQGRA
jgi:hypothetical protein